MKNKNTGFTLIELLVVIAIIGILATIVLTSLGNARTSAADEKVQGQLSGMRAQGELFAVANGASYGTATTTTDCSAGSLFLAGTNTIFNLIPTTTGYTNNCYTNPSASSGNASAWAVTSSRGTAIGWCVDSSGQSKVYTGAAATTPVAAVCQ